METTMARRRGSGSLFPILVLLALVVITAVLTLVASEAATRTFMIGAAIAVFIGGFVWDFWRKRQQ